MVRPLLTGGAGVVTQPSQKGGTCPLGACLQSCKVPGRGLIRRMRPSRLSRTTFIQLEAIGGQRWCISIVCGSIWGPASFPGEARRVAPQGLHHLDPRMPAMFLWGAMTRAANCEPCDRSDISSDKDFRVDNPPTWLKDYVHI